MTATVWGGVPGRGSRRGGLLRAGVTLGLAVVVAGALLVVADDISDRADRADPVIDQRLTAGARVGGTTGASIADLQAHLRRFPDDAEGWARLGFLYLEEARVTVDPSYYPKAHGALAKSSALQRNGNWRSMAGLGALANARHDFASGARWARRALEINPRSEDALGVLGDALVELGSYDEAFAAIQRMVDVRPGLSAYARVSYARELQGDLDGAAAAMEEAGRAAGTPTGRAFAEQHLGELEWNRGRIEEAAAHFELAARLDPAYTPPLAGLARVAWATGDLETAQQRYEEAVARYPIPQFVTELGDLYALTGRPRLADEQYALVRAQRSLAEANQVNTDLEHALFSADHGAGLAAGLAAARAQRASTESVFAADALAWQLHVHGLDDEALVYANEALALGYRSASFLYHRGVIHHALGHTDEARADLDAALSLNPHFSILHAERAAALLRSLPSS